jgi:hypothetical protein
MDPNGEAQRRAMAQRLRELPHELRPPFGWNELQRRARLPRRLRVSSDRLPRVAAAIAACLTLMLALAMWIHSGPPARQRDGGQVEQAAVRSPGEDGALAGAELEQMAAAPYGRALVRVSTRLAVQELEDRIASVDDQLTIERVEKGRDVQLRALQRDRARMIDSLAQVRYAESLAAELP